MKEGGSDFFPLSLKFNRFANLFEKSWPPVYVPLMLSTHLTIHTEQKGGLCPSHAAGHSPKADNSLNTEVQRDGELKRAAGGAAVGPGWSFSIREGPTSCLVLAFFPHFFCGCILVSPFTLPVPPPPPSQCE